MPIIIIVIVTIALYYGIYKPQKKAKEKADFEAKVASCADSDFVNHCMQILAFLTICMEDSSAGSVFCVNQGGQLLISFKARMDTLVFLVKRQNDCDGIRRADGTIVETYGDMLMNNFNSMLKRAQGLDTRLESISCFRDLQLNYYQDPEDTYDEWLIFETRFPIPSPVTAHMRALELEVQSKQFIRNNSIDIIY